MGNRMVKKIVFLLANLLLSISFMLLAKKFIIALFCLPLIDLIFIRVVFNKCKNREISFVLFLLTVILSLVPIITSAICFDAGGFSIMVLSTVLIITIPLTVSTPVFIFVKYKEQK